MKIILHTGRERERERESKQTDRQRQHIVLEASRDII